MAGIGDDLHGWPPDRGVPAGDPWARLCRWAAMLLAAAALIVGGRTVLADVTRGAEGSATAPPVRLLEVRGAIGPATADYLMRGIARAAAAGAPLLVVEIDTPGGLDQAMREIVQAFLGAPLPVAVYVAPSGARAASAGTYLLYAAHIAAMAPATTLGAATPVSIGLAGAGDGEPPARRPAGGAASPPPSSGAASDADGGGAGPADAMAAKRVNDAAAFIRGLAQQRGRNAEWAERAVREAASLTAAEAVAAGVVDVVAPDLASLLDRIEGRTVQVRGRPVALHVRGAAIERVAPDWRQRLLSAVTDPSVALVLMMIGFYGLVLEFSSPGFGVAGVVGAISLIVALFALQMLPVNGAGLALIALGAALGVAELLSPSFGVLGVGGLIAFIAGGLLLFDDDVPGFGVSPLLVFALAACSALVVAGAGAMALRARRRPVVSGVEDLLGADGTVVDAGGGAGTAWAEVRGERWRVECPTGSLAVGRRVRVVAVRGLTLEVRALEAAAVPGPSGTVGAAPAGNGGGR
jgi:membrane-bound serine protease (ClpP class)